MKFKERESKRSLTVTELRAELLQTREKRFRLQFKHGVSPTKNPMELRDLRRHIARLETWIRQKEEEASVAENTSGREKSSPNKS